MIMHLIFEGFSGDMEYEYATHGNFTFTLNVSNLISFQTAKVYLPVQKGISNFHLVQALPIAYGDAITLDLAMDDGSDYTLTCTFGGQTIADIMVPEDTLHGNTSIPSSVHDPIGKIGDFQLIANAVNLISSGQINETLSIYYKIEGLSFFRSIYYVICGTVVTLTWTTEQASRYNVNINWDDGTVDFNNFYALTMTGDEENTSHIFNMAKTSTVIISASNPVSNASNNHTLIVQWPPRNITLVAPDFVPIYLAVSNVSATFQLVLAPSVNAPTDASLRYTMGTGSNVPVVEPVDFVSSNPSTYMFKYSSIGTYEITFNISNLIGYLTYNKTLTVDQHVTHLTAVPLPIHVRVNQSTNLIVTMVWGSRFQVTIDWTDSTALTVADYVSYTDTIQHSHIFISPGVYTVLVKVVNSLGPTSFTINPPIIVQYPVLTRCITLGGDQLIFLTDPWDVVYKLDILIKPDCIDIAPTNVTISVLFGDGSAAVEVPFVAAADSSRNTSTHSHWLTITHANKYKLGDNYTITAQMWNLVSNETFEYNIHIIEKIHHMSCKILYIDNNATEKEGVTTTGGTHPSFTTDLLIYRCTKVRGTDIRYSWIFGDGESISVYDTLEVHHNFSLPGSYKVYVNADNMINKYTQQWDIITMKRVQPITTIWVDDPRPKNTTFDFKLFVGWIPTRACYKVDLVDTGAYMAPMRYLGDLNECKRVHGSNICDGSQLWKPSIVFCSEVNNAEFETNKANSIDNKANITVQTVMMTLGVHLVTLEAHNLVTQWQSQHETTVTRGWCWTPKLQLKNIDQKVISKTSDMTHQKSKPLFIVSDAFINCTSTSIRNYTWQIKPVGQSAVIPLLSNKGCSEAKFEGNALTSLLIPKRCLNYGQYNITLNISMYGETNIWAINWTVVHVVKTPITAKQSVTEAKAQWNSNVTMNVFNTSTAYDPDVNDGEEADSAFQCQWFCQRECEPSLVFIQDENDIWYWDGTYTGVRTCQPPLVIESDTDEDIPQDDDTGCYKYDNEDIAGR